MNPRCAGHGPRVRLEGRSGMKRGRTAARRDEDVDGGNFIGERKGPDRGCRSGLSLFYLLITSFPSLRRPGIIAEEVRRDITERLLSCFAGCRSKPCHRFRIEIPK